jgi:hypothetical protein
MTCSLPRRHAERLAEIGEIPLREIADEFQPPHDKSLQLTFRRSPQSSTVRQSPHLAAHTQRTLIVRDSGVTPPRPKGKSNQGIV